MSSRNSMAQYKRTLEKVRDDLAELEVEHESIEAKITSSRTIVEALESLLHVKSNGAKPESAQQPPQAS